MRATLWYTFSCSKWLFPRSWCMSIRHTGLTIWNIVIAPQFPTWKLPGSHPTAIKGWLIINQTLYVSTWSAHSFWTNTSHFYGVMHANLDSTIFNCIAKWLLYTDFIWMCENNEASCCSFRSLSIWFLTENMIMTEYMKKWSSLKFTGKTYSIATLSNFVAIASTW